MRKYILSGVLGSIHVVLFFLMSSSSIATSDEYRVSSVSNEIICRTAHIVSQCYTKNSVPKLMQLYIDNKGVTDQLFKELSEQTVLIHKDELHNILTSINENKEELLQVRLSRRIKSVRYENASFSNETLSKSSKVSNRKTMLNAEFSGISFKHFRESYSVVAVLQTKDKFENLSNRKSVALFQKQLKTENRDEVTISLLKSSNIDVEDFTATIVASFRPRKSKPPTDAKLQEEYQIRMDEIKKMLSGSGELQAIESKDR